MKDLMTIEEAAAYLNITRSQIDTMVWKRRITFYKPTGLRGPTMFLRSDLDAHIENSRVSAKT